MPIDTLKLNRPQRKRVAWFGSAAPNDGKTAFTQRGFEVVSYSAKDLNEPANVAALAAVIFTQNENDLAEISQELKAHALQLLDYDCRLIIRACDRRELYRQPMRIIANAANALHLWTVGLPPHEADKLRSWQRKDPGDVPLPHARVFGLAAGWQEVANFVMEHQPGPAPDFNLTIVPEAERLRLRPGYETMLRRAFWDCSEIHLKRMDDGRSGVWVYRAHAELAEGQHGRWPMPYFVKIGNRSKIFDEYVNYEDKVDPYVPYHLGPHLIRDRCCLGAKSGVIVGDFVEESQSLVDCAQAGRAGPAIACLFDRALIGWHRIAKKETEESYKIAVGFRNKFPEMDASFAPRIARARDFGAKRDLSALRSLFGRCTSTPVLVGPIHGDLHAANVLVRATDAILIDFLAHRSGPLVYDAACLEASLLVDGFRDGRKLIRDTLSPEQVKELDADVQAWWQSIVQLYDEVSLKDGLLHPNPKNPSCWFYACVQQIRRYARQMQSGDNQYAAALALALLIKATKNLDASEPEASRRAAAYAIAERVLVNTFKTDDEGNRT